MHSAATQLDAALRAVAPILGVSIGRRDDKVTWRIDFASEATQAQRDAAAKVVTVFDVAAVEGAEAAERDAQATLAAEARADQLAATLATATGAQIAAFVANTFPGMTAQQRAVLKLLLHLAALSLRRGVG
jgi:hypothetical protein